MRRSSAFVAIPTVPTTLSGQWLTFSHMANHYRKLLNVKPRVQTNLPRKPASSATMAPQASTKKLSKKLSTSSAKHGRRDSSSVQSNAGLRVISSVPKVNSYQILFDQSELNNLSEAVVSESECEDEGHLHQMPISEKINLYLDQLQNFDENASLVSSVSQFGRVQSASVPVVAKSKATCSKPGLGRHSRCFAPFVPSDRPNLKVAPASTLQKKLPASKPKKVSTKSGLQKNPPASTSNRPRRSVSPHSSIGTVAGSDYLENLFIASLVSGSNIIPKTTKVKGNGTHLAAILPNRTHKPGGVLKPVNNRPPMSAVASNVNNKDSSRDSAYGFSSGESKITTRESTPEKKKVNKRVHTEKGSKSKYTSNLSTVASSTNQESVSESMHMASSRGKCKNLLPASSDKYINFITAVTEDVIKREVFTNKGLKSLFMAHVEANQDLEMNKMLQMLDRLRMDVGIPKDDSLNQLDFGYGSIKYSMTSFFSKPPLFDHVVTTVDRVRVAPSSDISIRQIHAPPQNPDAKGFRSGDDSSKISSCSVSVVDQCLDDIPSRDLSTSSSSKSSVSLTASEIERALGQVGFGAQVAQDIARITKLPRKPKQKQHRSRHNEAELKILPELNNNNKPSSLKSSRNLSERESYSEED